jgi:glucose 1-dehydrogenase
MELQGKVALVTGASSGIGYAIAERFGAEGAAVVINYVAYDDEAQELAQRLSSNGGRALALKADITDETQVNQMVERARGEFGTVDVLVNNAGIERSAPILEKPISDWDKIIGVNLRGAFMCLQACGRVMRDAGRGGSIVNISSVHEDVPFPGFAAYCASKGGMRMLMRDAALELAEYGIRVNNVAPGAIETPINKATLADPEKVKALNSIIPLGHPGQPDDVAQVALFLASDRARYVTGSTYYVDGGMVRYAQAL